MTPRPPAAKKRVTLAGGPFDGLEIGSLPGARSLLIETDDPETVARYRPTRDHPGTYRFCGFARVIARIPRDRDYGDETSGA